MKIVGVDLSLTGTGIAVITDDHVENGFMPHVETRLIKSTPGLPSLNGRFSRMERIAASIVAECKGADLVVIEGPSLGSKHGSQWDRAGLWWWVVSILHVLGTPVVEVPPTTLKKWATNNGGASKSAVAVAISKLWPDVTVKDDNEADALCLATIGAQKAGLPVSVRAHHKPAVSKVGWPTNGPKGA